MHIKTVVWNMSQKSNWNVLAEHPDLAEADIALLCEASGVREQPEAIGLNAAGNGSTKGLDCMCTGASDECTKRRYSTAVVPLTRSVRCRRTHGLALEPPCRFGPLARELGLRRG